MIQKIPNIIDLHLRFIYFILFYFFNSLCLRGWENRCWCANTDDDSVLKFSLQLINCLSCWRRISRWFTFTLVLPYTFVSFSLSFVNVDERYKTRGMIFSLELIAKISHRLNRAIKSVQSTDPSSYIHSLASLTNRTGFFFFFSIYFILLSSSRSVEKSQFNE